MSTFRVAELVDQYRNHDCKEQSDWNGDNGEDQSIFQRSGKPFICPQILEICEPYEIPVSDSLCEIPVRQTYVQGDHQRDQAKTYYTDQARRQKGICNQILYFCAVL